MIIRELDDEAAHYRVIVPRWSYAPTSGAGARKHGGRFNRPGMEALYLSRDTETAIAEFRQSAALLPPGILTTFIVSKLRVVDFSAGFEPGKWEPLWSEYDCNWRQLALDAKREPPSWVMGDLAFDAGANGILAPSLLHPGGVNLVLFNASALPVEQLRVHDPDGHLPMNAESWK